METKEAYLARHKEEALRRIASEGAYLAWNWFFAEMNRHPEAAQHRRLAVGAMMVLAGQLTTNDEMRAFIEGFVYPDED